MAKPIESVETGREIHVLIVTNIGYGNINPLFRLGKLLASKGLLVTLSPPQSISKYIKATNNFTEHPVPIGNGFIRLEPFEDGWESNIPSFGDSKRYVLQIEEIGRQSLPDLIERNSKRGHPISCIINNPFNPWVFDVAERIGLPIATLWIQSCACFAAYYHYFHDLVPFPDEQNLEIEVKLPSMPLLKSDQVPTFLHPTTPHPQQKKNLMNLFEKLDKACFILMETFQDLEPEIINSMSKLCRFKTIGPLFKQPIVETTSVCSDLNKAEDCMDWLATKPPSSVAYISFGSTANLEKEQWNEIFHGLLNSGITFLLVVTKSPITLLNGEFFASSKELLEKAGDKGKIVQWTPQEKVLAHPSIACFLTHCGWNSTMEALGCGVPVVTFPMWGDQVTNSKYLVDVFKVGVKMDCKEEAGKKVITRDEVERCLFEVTLGPKAMEMKQNALIWKGLAEAAVAEGGSSTSNIQSVVKELKQMREELN